MKINSLIFSMRFVLFFVFISLFMSVFVLVDPMGSFGAGLGDRAQLSQAIATALALVLGSLAIMMVVHVEGDEFKAQARVRGDIAQLLGALDSICIKTVVAQMNNQKASIEDELEKVSEFVTGTTGFAFRCWINKKHVEAGKNPEIWRTFFLSLAQLQVLGNRIPVIKSIFETLKLSEREIGEISVYFNDFDNSIPLWLETPKTDVIYQALFSKIEKERKKETATLHPRWEEAVESQKHNEGLYQELLETKNRALAGDQASIQLLNAVVSKILGEA